MNAPDKQTDAQSNDARPGDAVPAGKPRTSPPLTRLDRPRNPPSPPGEEHGGPAGPEPTRYNDWERKGRVSDF